MSLDVYLKVAEPVSVPRGSGIFVREGGMTKEISREEWDARNHGREPVVANIERSESTTVYQANITHNLNTMAEAAGIYKHLWRPDEIGVKQAWELVDPLEAGLEYLKIDPEKFKAFNPPNGWGNYEGLIRFVESYLHACKQHPAATVEVSR